MMIAEMSAQTSNLANGWGDMYETLFFSRASGEFKYIDNLVYASSICEFDDNGRLISFHLVKSSIIHYLVEGEFCIVIRTDGNGRTDVNMISPASPSDDNIGRAIAFELVSNGRGRMFGGAEYFCLMVNLVSADFVNRSVITLPREDAISRGILLPKSGGFEIAMQRNLLEELYRCIRQDMNSNPARRATPPAEAS